MKGESGKKPIPTADIPPLCSQIAELLGHSRSPLTLSARRCMIDDWLASVRRLSLIHI